MKNRIFMMVLAGLFFVTASPQEYKSFHDFQVTDIDGNVFDLGSLVGKKVLVVNTASKCGFTPQYADLEKLYKEYGNRNFVVVGFPANDFLGQEPGTDEEIKAFCQLNYGVTFPMMSKISVRGKDIHPLYEWLTSKELNGVMDSEVSWNFQKYMIDEAGNLIGMVPPRKNPNSDEILDWLNN
ncbi:MAG: glutathione peroxidase [Bacteroidales bacterium]|nr:glutathione peroxidase [Bacteroidales bacterium]